MKKLVLATMLALTGLTITGCAVTGGQSSVGEYVDDKVIATAVKAKFADDPTVSAMRIQVESLNGEVQLAGFAKSDAEKARAAEIARGVSNVKRVRNDIVVRPAGY